MSYRPEYCAPLNVVTDNTLVIQQTFGCLFDWVNIGYNIIHQCLAHIEMTWCAQWEATLKEQGKEGGERTRGE